MPVSTTSSSSNSAATCKDSKGSDTSSSSCSTPTAAVTVTTPDTVLSSSSSSSKGGSNSKGGGNTKGKGSSSSTPCTANIMKQVQHEGGGVLSSGHSSVCLSLLSRLHRLAWTLAVHVGVYILVKIGRIPKAQADTGAQQLITELVKGDTWDAFTSRLLLAAATVGCLVCMAGLLWCVLQCGLWPVVATLADWLLRVVSCCCWGLLSAVSWTWWVLLWGPSWAVQAYLFVSGVILMSIGEQYAQNSRSIGFVAVLCVIQVMMAGGKWGALLALALIFCSSWIEKEPHLQLLLGAAPTISVTTLTLCGGGWVLELRYNNYVAILSYFSTAALAVWQGLMGLVAAHLSWLASSPTLAWFIPGKAVSLVVAGAQYVWLDLWAWVLPVSLYHELPTADSLPSCLAHNTPAHCQTLLALRYRKEQHLVTWLPTAAVLVLLAVYFLLVYAVALGALKGCSFGPLSAPSNWGTLQDIPQRTRTQHTRAQLRQQRLAARRQQKRAATQQGTDTARNAAQAAYHRYRAGMYD